MDIKLAKQSVTTEEVLLKTSGEISCEGSITGMTGKTPSRILKCSGRASVNSKSISDKTVTVEGTATLSVIYLDSDNCIRSGDNTLLFSKTFEGDTSLYGGEVFTCITDEKYSASVNQNGCIDLSLRLGLSVTVRQNVEKEIICDIDCRDIERLAGRAEITMPVAKGEKNLIVEEDLSVGNGQPSVECVIRHSVTAAVEETKIISGKVMVKGTLRVYVLYLPDEGTRPQSFEDSFPFSQLVDADGVGENCMCDSSATVLFSELTPRSGDDDVRSFSFVAKIAVSVKAYCDDEIPVLFDAYSTKDGCRITRGEHTFKKIRENINDRFIARKEIEFTDGAIGSVIDMWCEIKNHSSRFENGELRLTGTCIANILAFDCDGLPNCYERPVDFEYCYAPTQPLISPEAVCGLSVAHCSYTIMGANTVAVSVEPQITAAVYDNIKYDLLTDICEDSECTVNRRNSSIVLYFADAGEKLWDIARRYNSSVDEIKSINSVSEDILTEPRKFIIPTK